MTQGSEEHNGLDDSLDKSDKEKEANGELVKQTAYDRLSSDLSNDQKHLKELTLGKRIGFYRLRGELGTGNFSQVRMGLHCLTKGKFYD